MLNFPVEIQLAVLSHLDALDIARLELVCKRFRTLIEEHGMIVWKRCLHRHCARHGVFWPTFHGLTRAEEFKRAVSAPSRMLTSYRRSVARGEPMGVKSRIVGDIPQELFLGDSQPIGWTHLVAGGRFLLNLKERCLNIWDIHSTPYPTIAGRVPLDDLQPDSCGFRVTLQDENTLRVLHVARVEVPVRFAPAVPLGSASQSCIARRWVLLELSLDQNTGRFNGEKLGDVTLIQPAGLQAELAKEALILDSQVTFSLRSSRKGGFTTVVWNFVQEKYTAWELEEGQMADCEHLFTIVSHCGFTIYMTKANIYGFKTPLAFQPIQDGLIFLPSVTGDGTTESPIPTVSPSFSLPHPFDYSNTEHSLLMGVQTPPQQNRASSSHRLFEYYVAIAHGAFPLPLRFSSTRSERIEMHRYQLEVDPQTPSCSTLERVEVLAGPHPSSFLTPVGGYTPWTLETSDETIAQFWSTCLPNIGGITATYPYLLSLVKHQPSVKETPTLNFVSVNIENNVRGARRIFHSIAMGRIVRVFLNPGEREGGRRLEIHDLAL
ncbi:hypothetical protein NMY22_g9496 [Coprinellus aureogranulatus]|nr:hypothetical protein NMY22_g9496 [Coprinellus aureogranulatus]